MHVPEVAADDVSQEGIAVAGAAAIVGPEHGVASRRQNRHVVDDDTGTVPELVGFLGSAVHLYHERIAFPGLVGQRIEEQALDRDAVGALPRDRKSTRLNS